MSVVELADSKIASLASQGLLDPATLTLDKMRAICAAAPVSEVATVVDDVRYCVKSGLGADIEFPAESDPERTAEGITKKAASNIRCGPARLDKIKVLAGSAPAPSGPAYPGPTWTTMTTPAAASGFFDNAVALGHIAHRRHGFGFPNQYPGN